MIKLYFIKQLNYIIKLILKVLNFMFIINHLKSVTKIFIP